MSVATSGGRASEIIMNRPDEIIIHESDQIPYSPLSRASSGYFISIDKIININYDIIML